MFEFSVDSPAPPADPTAEAQLALETKLKLNAIAGVRGKKVISPEAQHIISVLDECVRKIEVSAFLPCELVHSERVTQELRDPAVEALREHLKLCKEYSTLWGSRNEETMELAVKNSLRNFLRHVKPHKEVETVKAVLQEAGPVIQKDQKAVQEVAVWLREYRAVLKERLMATPQEERERRRLGHEARNRQQHNEELLQMLEGKVKAATEHRDTTICKKDKEIERIKDSLHQMQTEWEQTMAQVQKKTEEQHQLDLKNSEVKRLQLLEEGNQLRTQLENLTKQHREKEATLLKKNNKLETEIENWIQKYDAEMEEKQERVEQMREMYEEERAKLRELQDLFSVLELEYTQIMEEKRREREQKEKEEQEREMRNKASVVIQALWRGYRLRKALKNQSQTKKGKKGKKGTKGKKKK
ncbi:dynein regulatory complex protein 10 [Silurus meridionalis]|nr:dynein regulatory complex protein 10 [Silurus meridionalis]KAI5089636.1 IQ domain-containing protein D isoform X2 [Silurus meridionalis]